MASSVLTVLSFSTPCCLVPAVFNDCSACDSASGCRRVRPRPCPAKQGCGPWSGQLTVVIAACLPCRYKQHLQPLSVNTRESCHIDHDSKRHHEIVRFACERPRAHAGMSRQCTPPSRCPRYAKRESSAILMPVKTNHQCTMWSGSQPHKAMVGPVVQCLHQSPNACVCVF